MKIDLWIGGRSWESNPPEIAGNLNRIWSPAASPETTIFRARSGEHFNANTQGIQVGK